MTPCFGPFFPDFRCLNIAFSAPSSWTVDDGRLASLSNPPAREIILAARGPPSMAHMLGQVASTIPWMYSSVRVLSS